MKKRGIVLVLALALAIPAFPQLRLDLGVDVPRGVGASNGATSIGTTAGKWPFIPLPEGALHYQFLDLGVLKAGIGVRAFTLIVETIAWPNAFCEADFGPVAVEAQVGGGAFALLGIAESTQLGKVFIPDLSAWVRLGSSLRLGAGVIGLYVPEAFGDYVPFLIYVGGKIAIYL